MQEVVAADAIPKLAAQASRESDCHNYIRLAAAALLGSLAVHFPAALTALESIDIPRLFKMLGMSSTANLKVAGPLRAPAAKVRCVEGRDSCIKALHCLAVVFLGKIRCQRRLVPSPFLCAEWHGSASSAKAGQVDKSGGYKRAGNGRAGKLVRLQLISMQGGCVDAVVVVFTDTTPHV